MKKVLPITLTLLLISAAAFAGEKTIPTGNKPAPASAMKAEEECVIPKLEHEEKLPSGETITIKDPIPETLSDKCYCQAVEKIYVFVFTHPSGQQTVLISYDHLLSMTDRAFRCIHWEAPKNVLLTKEIRNAIREKDFETSGESHQNSPYAPKYNEAVPGR